MTLTELGLTREAAERLLAQTPRLFNRRVRRGLQRALTRPYGAPIHLFTDRPDRHRPYWYGGRLMERHVFRYVAARAAIALGLCRRKQKRCARRAVQMFARA